MNNDKTKQWIKDRLPIEYIISTIIVYRNINDFFIPSIYFEYKEDGSILIKGKKKDRNLRGKNGNFFKIAYVESCYI